MNKVGIITLNGYFNYGNRLQNYALQETLEKLGFEVETIINETKFNEAIHYKNKFIKLKEKKTTELYAIVINKIQNYLYKDKLNAKRVQIFKSFSRSYINETKFSISEENIPTDLLERYDYFVTGSDQVWNPYYRKGSSVEFLTFAPIEKRIAYAPSFGVSEIPEKYKEKYKEWLIEIPHLSVREVAGANIIKKLTNREVPVLVDPTMLLSKEQWLSISEIPSNKPLKRYLLTYFLGNISKSRMKQIKEFANKNNLEIVHLAQLRDRNAYLSGPSEFIDYINSATLLCTDSFHGTVFAILLGTPFIAFNREGKSYSMNSRIETLLKKFHLESRLAENIKSIDQIFEMDFSHTIPILKEERNRSYNFLKKALNINH